jgi:hypothetical protein
MDPLAKLFGSPARVKLLRLFGFNQDTGFTLIEVADRTKLSQETVRRELAALVALGFLRKKGRGAAALYAVSQRFEYLPALTQFIREVTTVRPARIVSACKRAGTIRLIALSGFFTGMLEPQVDLLVVGDNLSDRALAKSVKELEAELGREIRYAAFSTPDFRYRVGIYDRLLRDVFDYPHRLLLDKIGL